MRRSDLSFVYLDMRPLGIEQILHRFPTIVATCRTFGLDVTKDPVPVRPSAHYMMGGIHTDLTGRTKVERLFAAGECACTGVHGANRLASNSLLEGLVFGRAAGRAAAEVALSGPVKFPLLRVGENRQAAGGPIDVGDVSRSLKHLLWRAAGIFRHADGLSRAERTLAFWRRYVLSALFTDPRAQEVQNMIMVATLLLRSAAQRTESRGAHRRADYPQTDDANWRRHVRLSLDDFEDAPAPPAPQ
jgi:L-aspartate oxidase